MKFLDRIPKKRRIWVFAGLALLAVLLAALLWPKGAAHTVTGENLLKTAVSPNTRRTAAAPGMKTPM